MRAIMVSVDYTDLLSITLSYNRHHFDEVYIVTSIADYDNVLAIAEPNGAKVIRTDLFYADGARFNKFRSLEYGLDVMGRHGWMCVMDADVLWPHYIPSMSEGEGTSAPNMFKGYLYTPLRRMCPWPLPSVPNEHCKTCYGSGTMYAPPLKDQEEQALKNQRVWATHVPCKCRTSVIPPENEWTKYPVHRNTKEWAGYSQIFHADDPVLGQPPWYDISWSHAGGADSAFQYRWPDNRKVRPPWEVLHLGEAGMNWYGRSTPYADGTSNPEAEARKRAMTNVWASRRGKIGATKFAPEKIAIPSD
jgi:hypothetical protein